MIYEVLRKLTKAGRQPDPSEDEYIEKLTRRDGYYIEPPPRAIPPYSSRGNNAKDQKKATRVTAPAIQGDGTGSASQPTNLSLVPPSPSVTRSN